MHEPIPTKKVSLLILAGGKGTRMQGVGDVIPKPMLLVNGKPILWYIINHYHQFGVRDFNIATGHRHDVVDAWVKNSADAVFENSYVSTIYTGEDTKTGGRIKLALEHLHHPDGPLFMTYGDGLSNINISSLLATWEVRGRPMVVLSAVRPVPRFGALQFDSGGAVTAFAEKQDYMESWINGGFMVLRSEIARFIRDENTNFEKQVLPMLCKMNQVEALPHDGFWKCVDAPRDLEELNSLAKEETPPWKI